MVLDHDQHVRLEILKVLVPAATRNALAGEAEIILGTARQLEKYVLESQQSGEVTPDSPNRRILTRPRKEKVEDGTPAFMTPPSVDKSNQAPG